jgi:glycosyltransferase involved in cell wall biosynthesis
MEKPLVSIIVPVYKVEKYLAECVDSILIQNYEKIEILLVDDGSPDSCPKLCDNYATQYANITTIHQKNGGLGCARNTGLEHAKGTYIVFIDSDDRLDGEDAICLLVDKAEKTQADIVVGSFRRFDEKSISEVNHHHLREGNYTKSADFRFKGFYMYGHLAYDWGKLYRKSFFDSNHLKCMTYPFTQDKAHNIQCYACNPTYAFVDESVYLYRVNEESVTFRYKDNLIPVWTSIATDFLKFLKKRNLKNQYEDLPAFHIFFGSFFIVKQELQFHGIRAAVKALRRYGNHRYVKKVMKELAHGKYTKDIESKNWKILIPMAAFLFHIHAYYPFVIGIACLRMMKIDSKITKSRYKRKPKQMEEA